MKFVFIPAILATVFSMYSLKASAQLDSSYELLLGSSGHHSPVKATEPENKTENKKRKPARENAETNVQKAGEPSEATSAPLSEKAVLVDGRPLPIKLQNEPTDKVIRPEPSISEQAESLFTANPETVLGFYEENLDESDPRHNKIEINFAPTLINNESASSYSFRDYRSSFAAVSLGANVWLTPAIGVGGNFVFSLGADTSGDAATDTHSPARQEFLDVALKFRKFFGFSKTSKSLEFDVLYTDYKFNVGSDDPYRAKLKSSGLGLKMNLKLPSSNDVAWTMGASFFPRLQHVEGETGIDLKSGNNTENVRLGLHLGAEVVLSRESQIFYEMSALSEKNLFDGAATLADPATGLTPKNISVSNTFYVFSVGYRWGN